MGPVSRCRILEECFSDRFVMMNVVVLGTLMSFSCGYDMLVRTVLQIGLSVICNCEFFLDY